MVEPENLDAAEEKSLEEILAESRRMLSEQAETKAAMAKHDTSSLWNEGYVDRDSGEPIDWPVETDPDKFLTNSPVYANVVASDRAARRMAKDGAYSDGTTPDDLKLAVGSKSDLGNHEALVEDGTLSFKRKDSQPTPDNGVSATPDLRETVKDWAFMKYVKSTDKGYKPVDLPSRFVFYPNMKGVGIRRFDLDSVYALAEAREWQSISWLVKAVGDTLAFDDPSFTVHDLTIPDFMYLCYMQRITSYKRSPYTFAWQSRYDPPGDKCLFEVNSSTFSEVKLDKTDEEYEPWRREGVVPPTVKDLEAIANYKLDGPTLMAWEKAQYLEGSSPEEKLAHLNARGIEAMELVRDFVEAGWSSYGASEYYEVTNPRFTPMRWRNSLLERIKFEEDILSRLRATVGDSDYNYQQTLLNIVAYKEDLDNLERRLRDGEIVRAEVERIQIKLNLLDFFPGF